MPEETPRQPEDANQPEGAPPEAPPETLSYPPGFKAGFVAIVGKANVGKSTLLNRLIGKKISIISPKPQTTRTRILGISTRPEAQICYLDTPGIQFGKSALEQQMLRASMSTLQEVDVILYMADATRLHASADPAVLGSLKDSGLPVVLALNKTDEATHAQIAESLRKLSQRFEFEAYIPISALTGDQVGIVERELIARLPESPPLYDPGTVTNLDEEFLVAEITREKILEKARQEVPHAVAVVVEHRGFDETRNMLAIHARIVVERESQKKILVGHKGSMIKEIGIAARQDVEALLGTRIYLGLLVSVRADWRNDERAIRKFGYERLT